MGCLFPTPVRAFLAHESSPNQGTTVYCIRKWNISHNGGGKPLSFQNITVILGDWGGGTRFFLRFFLILSINICRIKKNALRKNILKFYSRHFDNKGCLIFWVCVLKAQKSIFFYPLFFRPPTRFSQKTFSDNFNSQDFSIWS